MGCLLGRLSLGYVETSASYKVSLSAAVGLTHYENEPVSTEEIVHPSVEIFDFPVRSGETLRTFDFILPNFHFILPKFYFSPS